MRHDDIRDTTADILTEICPSVSIELTLQPLMGEQLQLLTANTEDEAQADICAQGFWGNKQQCAFFDVRVFNPLAPSYCQSSLTAVYRRNENEQRRAYEQRIIEIEHGSFTPLVLSATGGMGQATAVAYKRMASLLAEKRGQSYCRTMGWLQCVLNFSLIANPPNNHSIYPFIDPLNHLLLNSTHPIFTSWYPLLSPYSFLAHTPPLHDRTTSNTLVLLLSPEQCR